MLILISVMERLVEQFHQIIRDTPTSYVRAFSERIHWEERLISIIGAKGVGKTTLILQHIKLNLKDRKEIYLSADHPSFFGKTLMETVETFIRMGYEYFFLDEVHKYPGWSAEIKSLYDTYRKIRIVYSGSSIIHLADGTADLSRRAMAYELPGLSFREYLELVTGESLPKLELEDVLRSHTRVVPEILSRIRPYEHLGLYMENGYYPFFLETPLTYRARLEAAINQSLDGDLQAVRNISQAMVIKLKKLLAVIAESAPFKPNIQKISERTGINRNTLISYLKYLEEARIISQLFTEVHGIGSLQKPQKIYLENPNLIYALSGSAFQTGTLRETFVLNHISRSHQVTYPRAGDFMVDGKFTMEVGGRGKTQKQIADLPDAYVIADQIEVGHANKIPIWLIGFLS
jgi:hypothetical protein